ncbi:hypothetical protein SEUCBS139899_009073 [Sporothrix eucalyptigena]|uniref:Uncharacterized protein n=1 Tax=Sporothrix eucalyptigena TaxID=1812306 RepID=A0ABP0CHQ5_9PEZI
MGVPIAIYTNMARAGEGLTKDLQPDYNVVKVALSKDEALADLPGVFSSGGAKALIIAGFVSDEDAAAVSSAVSAASGSARIVRLSREDLEGAGIKLPPPGTPMPTGPPPADAPRPDPAVFVKLYREKLAGLTTLEFQFTATNSVTVVFMDATSTDPMDMVFSNFVFREASCVS